MNLETRCISPNTGKNASANAYVKLMNYFVPKKTSYPDPMGEYANSIEVCLNYFSFSTKLLDFSQNLCS